MRLRSGLVIGILAALASCAAPDTDNASDVLKIAPQDFVLLPCGPDQTDRSCALVAAGGKRVLFGAPSGAAASLPASELRQLDAVVLFSLRAHDIDGLDEIRNESWRAGRDAPLLTIGPRGVPFVVDALNAAFEQADALRIVEEGIPAGGYDAAILVAREAERDVVVFDTGDVQISRISRGYRITYERSANVDLMPCDPSGDDGALSPDAQISVSCEQTDRSLTWPLREPYFVVRETAP